MAKFHKKKSKRTKRRDKSKIIKKVSEHKRKHRCELKKIISKAIRKQSDPDIHNNQFLKDEIPLTAEQRRQRAEELLEVQKDSRWQMQMENRSIQDLIDEATQKVKDFKMFNDLEAKTESLGSKSHYKSFYMEPKKVVETADVILEVLDARDPLGCRCPQVEQLVISMGKKLILVLNKIDLIPKNNLTDWLKYLRQELPTVAFKAPVQTQNENYSKSEAAAVHITESLLSSRCCVGAPILMKLLENYCENQNTQTQVKVGIVGFPNVGKSSVINHLKQSYSCSDVAITGTANVVQKLSDKQIEILDHPGTVYAKDSSSVTSPLCNLGKLEELKDVISSVEAIFQRVDHTQLCLHYYVPPLSSCHELLCSLAEKMGKVKKGFPNSEDGARRLIEDWNNGKIKYYTNPPEMFIPSVYINNEYTMDMGKIFDISLTEEQIELDKAPLLFPIVSIAAKYSEPTEGLVEEMKMNKTLAKVSNESDTGRENRRSVKDRTDIQLTKYQVDKLLKKKYKKMKQRKKKFDKIAFALSESIDAALTIE